MEADVPILSTKVRIGKSYRQECPRNNAHLARSLTGKAASQAARSRRTPIENWQHWEWQHFHIGNIPATPNGGDFAILPASDKQEKEPSEAETDEPRRGFLRGRSIFVVKRVGLVRTSSCRF